VVPIRLKKSSPGTIPVQFSLIPQDDTDRGALRRPDQRRDTMKAATIVFHASFAFTLLIAVALLA
jgi:hypothetical protein